MQTQLIEDLLDMSRITSGKMRLDVQPVEPVTFIEAAIETVRPAADAKSIRLETVLDPAAGPIAGDPGRLQQVIWNLLSNAIKFTPRGGKVQIVARAREFAHRDDASPIRGVGIEARVRAAPVREVPAGRRLDDAQVRRPRASGSQSSRASSSCTVAPLGHEPGRRTGHHGYRTPASDGRSPRDGQT